MFRTSQSVHQKSLRKRSLAGGEWRSWAPRLKIAGRHIATYGFAQLFLQLTGLVAGVLVVRVLSSGEYALYTLGLTMLGTMTLLADSGISSGAMAEGGKVWKDPQALGIVIQTAETLRFRFALVGLALAVPALAYLLHDHGASVGSIILISVGIVIMFFTTLSDTILEVAPKLHQLIFPLSIIRCKQALGRLLLVSGVAFTLPVAGAIFLATVLPMWWGNKELRKLSASVGTPTNRSNEAVKLEILAVVRRVMPGAIFYCFSAQITIWIIAILGNTNSVAELGALGRLAQLAAIPSAMITGLLVPRFARLGPHRPPIRQWMIGILGVSILLGTLMCFAGFYGSMPLLWILGTKYMGLETELFWTLARSGISLIASAAYGLAAARGWIMNPWIEIPLTIAGLAAPMPFLDLSTVKGVLQLSFIGALVPLVARLVFLHVKVEATPDSASQPTTHA